MKKLYPESVSLKKGLLVVVIIAMALIMVLIIFNIYNATHLKQHIEITNHQKIESFASAADTRWYQVSHPRQVVNAQPVPSKPPKRAPVSLIDAPRLQRRMDDLQHEAKKEALQKAMSAPIGSNQLVAEPQTSSSPTLNPSSISPEGLGQDRHDPSMQTQKLAFLQSNNGVGRDYLSTTLQNPISPYELQVGSIIPGVMIGGINSDLPGQITASVRFNVYDSITGRYLLIPQGSKLDGRYDSQVAYGQERVLVVWDRIIFPNGQNINLQGMAGVDMSGYAGFRDEVDHHYGKIFGSVILMSALGAGAQLAQPQQAANNPWVAPTVGQTIAQSVGTNIANTGTLITSKSINIPSTLGIRPGYKFNIQVKKNIVFPSPYRGD